MTTAAPSSPKSANTTGAPPPPGRVGPVLWTLLAAALLGGGAWWLVYIRKAAAAAMVGRMGMMPAAPVVIAPVTQGDFPVYLEGIGTVQAFNTVTVRSRVDGQLVKVGFIEGQDVKAGDLLAQIDPEPFRIAVEQAEARKAQDQAQLDNALVELKRDTDLLGQKVVAQSVFDAQQALVNQYKAAVLSDQATVDNARLQLGWTSITSPIDGRTGVRLVDQGNNVHATDANGIVVITQVRPISVMFTIPEQNLGAIQRELAKGTLEVTALDRDNQTTIAKGLLTVIDNQIDTTIGSLKLKAKFANDDLRLWPGQFVNVRLRLSTERNALVTPANVIQRGPEGAFVYVVQQGEGTNLVAKVRKVMVGGVRDGTAWITNGVGNGERVVVDGQYRLQDGSKVRPARSAGAAAAAEN
jgi:membrane fusion protein, multidrug efflux system